MDSTREGRQASQRDFEEQLTCLVTEAIESGESIQGAYFVSTTESSGVEVEITDVER